MEDAKLTGKVADLRLCWRAPSHEWNQETKSCKHCGDRYPTSDEGFDMELRQLLNRYSRENASDTPDFILRDYIQGCLTAFNEAVKAREKWYGRDEPRTGALAGPFSLDAPADPDPDQPAA